MSRLAATRERKLTRDQVRELLAAYEAGEALTVIAARFGVTAAAVSYHAATKTVLRCDRPVEHGTRKRYLPPYKCRCPQCRAANAAHSRKYAKAVVKP